MILTDHSASFFVPCRLEKAMTSKSKTHSGPNLFYEEEAIAEGHAFIAGVDEVGRGPLAGIFLKV